MRIVLLSDIHGNTLALDAVLADIEALGGVEQIWVLGDLVAMGPDPVGVLERLTALPHVRCTYGNTERYVLDGRRPWPQVEDVLAEPSLMPRLLQIARNFGWTEGALAAAGWLDWLAELPLELALTLPDGARLLGVHARPGHFDGHGLRPGLKPEQLDALTDGCPADLVCVGHTHWAMQLVHNDIYLVNLGSVSNPVQEDWRASYVLLEADEAGYQLEIRKVDYDHGVVISQLVAQKHPALDTIRGFLSGQRRPFWEQ
ncbi:MAG: metallophosphoesterase family protein [Caldilineaceae bacterium]|nr:metallophosphoesterase family protein [Caldilineaceae bacterium]